MYQLHTPERGTETGLTADGGTELLSGQSWLQSLGYDVSVSTLGTLCVRTHNPTPSGEIPPAANGTFPGSLTKLRVVNTSTPPMLWWDSRLSLPDTSCMGSLFCHFYPPVVTWSHLLLCLFTKYGKIALFTH